MSGVLALGLAACGDDDDEAATTTTVPVTQPAPVGSPTVSIDMLENSFAVSGPLTAGGTLVISNKGAELHMVVAQRFKPGKTLTDLQLALARVASAGGAPTTTTTVRGATTSTTVRGATTTTVAGATTTSTSRAAATTTSTTAAGGQGQNPFADILEDGGIPGAVMSPGESAAVMVPTLGAGTYALICFVPGEGDAVPHFVEGMVGQLEVVAGDVPAVPTADATYKVTKGKAVEGPATLTAGRHTLKFEVAAGGNQLEPALVRLNAGTTFAALDAAFTRVFESDTPPAKGTSARLPGQIVYGGMDFGTATTFYLTVDLKAGNYAIVAEDTDVEPKPPTKEIITVRVS